MCGRGAGRGKEGLLLDEEETHSGLEEEQMKYRWRHFKSGKEGRGYKSSRKSVIAQCVWQS